MMESEEARAIHIQERAEEMLLGAVAHQQQVTDRIVVLCGSESPPAMTDREWRTIAALCLHSINGAILRLNERMKQEPRP